MLKQKIIIVLLIIILILFILTLYLLYKNYYESNAISVNSVNSVNKLEKFNTSYYSLPSKTIFPITSITQPSTPSYLVNKISGLNLPFQIEILFNYTKDGVILSILNSNNNTTGYHLSLLEVFDNKLYMIIWTGGLTYIPIATIQKSTATNIVNYYCMLTISSTSISATVNNNTVFYNMPKNIIIGLPSLDSFYLGIGYSDTTYAKIGTAFIGTIFGLNVYDTIPINSDLYKQYTPPSRPAAILTITNPIPKYSINNQTFPLISGNGISPYSHICAPIADIITSFQIEH